MGSILRGEPESVVRSSGVLIVLGFLVALTAARFDFPGVISGTFLIYLGACGGSLLHWRSERGLWMLAVLFLLISAVIYGLFAYGQLRDFFRGVRQPELGLAMDFSLGTLLLSATVRFLYKVARSNWNLS
jgi:hypothetical protein